MKEYTLEKKAIIFEDNHLLVINKAPGLLSQGDKTGDANAVDVCKAYIKKAYNKPGNVYLGLPHRLDRPVSGCLLSCKTSKALERINKMIKARVIEKTYHAICLNAPPEAQARIVSYLIKDRIKNKVSSYTEAREGAQRSELEYRYMRQLSTGHHLLEVKLLTGRPHQIRVQLNSIGCPILGDLKYFRQEALPDKSIGLHARQLEFEHPVGQSALSFVADYPPTAWWKF